MASLTTLSPLKSLAKACGLSREILSEALGVPANQVAQWEKTLVGAPGIHVRDLAVLLDVPTAVLQGRKPAVEDEELRRASALYGSLKIRVKGHDLEYPVDQQARSATLSCMEALDIQSTDESSWLQIQTMNNKLVFLNPSAVKMVELVSDDEEASPSYEHEEIYAALEGWEVRDESSVGPVVLKRCMQIIDDAQSSNEDLSEHDLPPIKEAVYSRVLERDGRASWHFMLEDEDTLGYFYMELVAGTPVKKNRFLPVASEGYHKIRFVNLSHVAVIEVPLHRYGRLMEESLEAERKEATPAAVGGARSHSKTGA